MHILCDSNQQWLCTHHHHSHRGVGYNHGEHCALLLNIKNYISGLCLHLIRVSIPFTPDDP